MLFPYIYYKFLSCLRNVNFFPELSDGNIYNHHNILDKIQSLRSEHVQKRMVLVSGDFPPKLVFQRWCYDFFCC